MRRSLVTAAVAVVSLFAMGGVAQAQDPAGASQATNDYLDRIDDRLVDNGRLVDVESACLQREESTRFACAFHATLIVRDRRDRDHGHGGWDPPRASKSGDPDPDGRDRDRRRGRSRLYSCIGATSVVAFRDRYFVRLVFSDCARLRRAPAPEPVA